MNIGEKIKEIRKAKKITQSELAGQKITRNMLSSIERGVAKPSLDTIEYIAKKLNTPLAYFFADGDNLFFFEKQNNIKRIQEAFSAKSYKHCAELCEKLSDVDDELAYISAICHFKLGKKEMEKGSFKTAEKHFSSYEVLSKKTRYNLDVYDNAKKMYTCIIKNIQAPLLEFDADMFYISNDEATDFEFYKYFIHDYEYPFKNQTLLKHTKAKLAIIDKAYREAIRLLLEIEEDKNQKNYNVYVMFNVYSDLEQCYKQLFDFENAYRYASKKLSIIEGFKT